MLEDDRECQTYYEVRGFNDEQDEGDRALEYYGKALAIREKALGPEHPSTLRTVYNMGLLAEKSGDMAAAKALFVRCAKGYAKCYGPTHEETLDAQEAAARCS